MISQVIPGMDLIAYVIIIAGIVLVFIGIWLVTRSEQSQDLNGRSKSKGIVLIGPIPLIWGFSRRIQVILFIVALIIFVTWILWMY